MKITSQVIFQPMTFADLTLKNRIVMAPMSRARAHQALANTLMATYYGQRSTAGLIISESIAVSPNSLGMARIPGLFTEEQMTSWKEVTQTVHNKGGKIFAQLVHTGRITAKDNFLDEAKSLAPSNIPFDGNAWTPHGQKPYDIPQAMTENDIEQAIDEFVVAAKNAIRAGFDGVEIHAANGFLLNQFFDAKVNNRHDQWGGSIENRIRFATTVISQIADAIGPQKMGVRISPFGVANGMSSDDETTPLFEAFITALRQTNIAYLHVFDQGQESRLISPTWLKLAKAQFKGVMIVAGGYDLQRAENAITEGYADLVAMGTPFIANPDLVHLLQTGLPLKPTPQNAFYGEGAEGYTIFNETN